MIDGEKIINPFISLQVLLMYAHIYRDKKKIKKNTKRVVHILITETKYLLFFCQLNIHTQDERIVGGKQCLLSMPINAASAFTP